MPSGRRSGRRGGPATAAGIDFQARLTGLIVCAILAEREAVPFWDWPETETFESIYAETGQETDDLLVTNSAGGQAYVQAKLRLQVTKPEHSDLASALGDFVRQFLAARRCRDGLRPLEESRDRLVLAVGPASSNRIKTDLPRILRSIRNLPAGVEITEATRRSSAIDRDLLEIVTTHVARAWRNETGSDPTPADLRDLLSLVRVSVHDLTDDGAATQQAQQYLRSTVLQNPEQAGQVWRTIIAASLGFSADQTGTYRKKLQSDLADLGISLRAAPSFREDIEKLKRHSAKVVGRMERFSHIELADGQIVKLARQAPTALKTALEDQSVVITGAPGAGKSGTLFELIEQLRSENRDLVALSADILDSGSLGSLRQELDLEHDLVEVLQNWPGANSAFLVIDALDAARGELTQEALLDLIGETTVNVPRWHVGVSIRRFDLRYNRPLRDLYTVSGSSTPIPPEYFLEEFAGQRHFNVPLLTEVEQAQLEVLAPTLHEVVAAAPVALRDLVKVPFNLRLLAELISLDVQVAELEPITTQLQLLDKYWERRILAAASEAEALETVVRVACERIIETRTMQIDRATLQAASDPASLTAVFSNQVLIEQEISGGTIQREVVTFSHHVLFDYAVERLLFRGTPQRLVDRMTAQPELLILVRPSYDLHFRHLWELNADHSVFWEAALTLADREGIPEIGKIIAPGIAAELLEAVSNAAVLIAALRSNEQARRRSAEECLKHLVGALFVNKPAIADSQLTAWSEVAAALSGELRTETILPLRALLMELCDRPEALETNQRRLIGTAARRLLEFVLNMEQANRFLVGPAIEGVARTFETDPGDSERLLRLIIDRPRLERFGYVEMPELADEAMTLLEHDPALVRDVFKAAFEFEESSDQRTPIRSGVLALSSNKRQDYHMAQYRLAEVFPEFLARAPAEGIEALAAIRMAYTRRRASSGWEESVIEIRWGNRQAFVEEDGSHIWDQNALAHDDEVKILDAYERRLDELAEGDVPALESLIGLLIGPNIPASMWRRLLIAATRRPEIFAPLIEPLATSIETILSRDLSTALGEFLRVGFRFLSAEGREAIERTLFSLPDLYPDRRPGLPDARDYGEHTRDRLLGCLDANDLVTAEARARLGIIQQQDAIPSNEPPVRFSGMTGQPYGEREVLAEEGVDVDAGPNRRLQELGEPVAEFAKRHQNAIPPAEEVAAIADPLRQLWDTVQSAERDGAADEQRSYAWGHAAEAAETISRGLELDCAEEAVALSREILLRSAQHEAPLRNEASDEQFDEFPSWGLPSPRIQAAGGLLCLAFHELCVTGEMLDAIELLSRDHVPSVRMHIAQRVYRLRSTAPDLMVRICTHLAETDGSSSVLETLVTSLPRVVDDDDELVETVAAIYERVPADQTGATRVHDRSIELMTDLYVWRGNESARAFIATHVTVNISDHTSQATHAIHRLREALTHGDAGAEHSAIRARTRELFSAVLDSAVKGYNDAEAALAGRTDLHDEHPDVKRARDLGHVIDAIGSEVYFASGAYTGGGPNTVPIGRDKQKRFYDETGQLLDTLADVPFPTVTHHVLETLENFVDHDPSGVFDRIGRTIRGGQAGGYQFDSLAEGLFVRLMERYLAEQRAFLQRDEDAAALLIEILDVFVRAGWPRARQLTYGLHELFR